MNENSQRILLLKELKEGLFDLKLSLTPSQENNLISYIELLERWNKVYNLTAIRDCRKMLVSHVFDSLAVVLFIEQCKGKNILDVGSGGGLPGLILAIARPNWVITLNDVVEKKTAFLTHVKSQLLLSNVIVLNGRVEQLRIGDRVDYAFDIIISRAFSNLRDFLTGARHLLADNGVFCAMKGIYPSAEIDLLPKDFSVKSICKLNVPKLNAERHIIMITQNNKSLET